MLILHVHTYHNKVFKLTHLHTPLTNFDIRI